RGASAPLTLVRIARFRRSGRAFWALQKDFRQSPAKKIVAGGLYGQTAAASPKDAVFLYDLFQKRLKSKIST
ncbi:MAG: hypothetical protein PUD63_10800, partial [Clostridia bacterium]|nr:hypothetical protein [Clostridia bacterium]